MSFIYLPIETKTRELSARLALANKLNKCNQKSNIIILPQESFLIAAKYFNIPPGFVLYKSAQESVINELKLLKNKGFTTASTDEEAIVVFRNPENKIYTRYTEETLRYLDFIFAWTSDEYKLLCDLKESSKSKVKIIESGNYRTSKIFQEHDNIRPLKKKAKKILFVSSFCEAIPNFNSSYQIHIYEKDKRDHLKNLYYNWSKDTLYAFFVIGKLINELINIKEFKNFNFKLRPHPSDDKKIINKVFGKIDNLIIDDKYDIKDAIKESDLVIGGFCTTLLEARLMNKATISFIPSNLQKNNPYNIKPLTLSSICISEESELKNTILDLINNNFDDKDLYKNGLRKELISYSNADKDPIKIMSETIMESINNKKIGSHNIFIFKIKITIPFIYKIIQSLINNGTRHTFQKLRINPFNLSSLFLIIFRVFKKNKITIQL